MDKETPPWLQPVPAEEQVDSILSGDRTMLWIAGGAIGLVILFVAVIMYVYSEDRATEGPVRIAAPSTPVKERPEDRGGMRIDHQDKQVFDQSGDRVPASKMKLAGQPEQPVDKLPDGTQSPDTADDVADSAFTKDATDSRIDDVLKKTVDAKVETSTPAPSARTPSPEPAIKTAPQKAPASSPASSPVSMEGKYQVQLGAFGSREGAERTARDAQRKFREFLEGLTPVYEPVSTGDRTLYRLRFGPLTTRAEVDRICLALTAKGQGCMAVNP